MSICSPKSFLDLDAYKFVQAQTVEKNEILLSSSMSDSFAIELEVKGWKERVHHMIWLVQLWVHASSTALHPVWKQIIRVFPRMNIIFRIFVIWIVSILIKSPIPTSSLPILVGWKYSCTAWSKMTQIFSFQMLCMLVLLTLLSMIVNSLLGRSSKFWLVWLEIWWKLRWLPVLLATSS